MKLVQSLSTFAAIGAAALATSAWANTDVAHDGHHPAATVQIAQAKPGNPAPGMPGMPGAQGMPGMPGAQGMPGMAALPGYEAQMKAMQTMHDKMLAAKTPAERNALMAEQMKLMQDGMGMMNRMGPGAMAGKPADLPARQSMMEQRMDMMQSMMQMMMDRMPAVPAAK